MIYISTHAESISNILSSILRGTLNKMKSFLISFQRSREAYACSRILSEHGHRLTPEHREQIRQNLVNLMKK